MESVLVSESSSLTLQIVNYTIPLHAYIHLTQYFCRAAYEEELPTVGMAKSLMSQFKQKEAEAKQVQNYKPSGAGNRVCGITCNNTHHYKLADL